ncbi:MAG TPA: hypothetical protein VFQ38_04395 [Longimicrobiales bacterium]|nr:hypothetical protein [Longimicrobiales bacterium]
MERSEVVRRLGLDDLGEEAFLTLTFAEWSAVIRAVAAGDWGRARELLRQARRNAKVQEN